MADWFVVNVRDARWRTHETFGASCTARRGRSTCSWERATARARSSWRAREARTNGCSTRSPRSPAATAQARSGRRRHRRRPTRRSRRRPGKSDPTDGTSCRGPDASILTSLSDRGRPCRLSADSEEVSMRGEFRRWRRALVLAVAGVLTMAGVAGANVALTQVSSDPYTNPTSQHATEVEPDTFAYGSTVVAAFQVGRFFNGGATNIGFVRSGDGGTTWDTPGFLPGMTFTSGAVGSPYERVSDPSVAYDAVHGAWLISSIPLTPNTSVPTVFVNRSTDDGRTWSNPISIPPPVSNSVDLDKNWTVCDNVSSQFRGHCYTELDNFGDGDLELMSTSTDGGLTWSTPIRTGGNDKGLGGQPSGRGRHGLRRVGGLPLPQELHGQRHRVLEVVGRDRLERPGADPDRRRRQRRRPLHPGPGGRPVDLR